MNPDVMYCHVHDNSLKDCEAQHSIAASTPVNEWREAVIDALVINWTLDSTNENNPRKALQDLIRIETEMALDPKISGAAQALIDRGVEEEKARWRQGGKGY